MKNNTKNQALGNRDNGDTKKGGGFEKRDSVPSSKSGSGTTRADDYDDDKR